MKPIRVYEHESLKVDEKGFSSQHLDLLTKYLGDREADDFPYYSLIHKGVKFKQYVGVICVGDVQIEILPKADKSAGENDKDKWEHHLLEMLRTIYKLKISVPSKADQQTQRNHILDVFIDHFLGEVEHIMHIGLVKAYRRIENNCTSVKGRLVLSKHITQNIVHKERFYVDYTTYDRNHIFNRLLFKVLRMIPDITVCNDVIHKAKALMFEFPELNDIIANEALFNRLTFDRKTEDYRDAIDLAKMILLNYMPNLTYSHGNSVLALMFDMNKLWEKYIYIILKRNLSQYTVLAQNQKRFWHSNTVGLKTIRPDIVIIKDNKCIAVLDTKWKCPTDGKPSDADLKQMYVYHEYWDTPHTALLYPGSNSNVDGSFYPEASGCRNYGTSNEKKCSMIYIPLNNESESNELVNIKEVKNFIEDNNH